MSELDSCALKLTVSSSGAVWGLYGCSLPRMLVPCLSDLRMDQVLDDHIFHVLLPGSRQNASLILQLVEYRHRGPLDYSIYLVSPRLVCSDMSAALALYRTRAVCGLSASLGGPHRMDHHDAAVYASVVRAPGPLSISHALYEPLRFLPFVDLVACNRLVTDVLDPRWHVDLLNTDSDQMFLSYLGVCPWTPRRAQRVVDCWHTPAFLASLENGVAPGNFLGRIWHSFGPSALMQAASVAFLRYLRQSWLAALSPRGVSWRMFVPEHFFVSEADLQAYRSWKAGSLIL